MVITPPASGDGPGSPDASEAPASEPLSTEEVRKLLCVFETSFSERELQLMLSQMVEASAEEEAVADQSVHSRAFAEARAHG